MGTTGTRHEYRQHDGQRPRRPLVLRHGSQNTIRVARSKMEIQPNATLLRRHISSRISKPVLHHPRKPAIHTRHAGHRQRLLQLLLQLVPGQQPEPPPTRPHHLRTHMGIQSSHAGMVIVAGICTTEMGEVGVGVF